MIMLASPCFKAGDERLHETRPTELRRAGHRKTALPKFVEKLEVCRDLFHGFDYGDFMTHRVIWYVPELFPVVLTIYRLSRIHLMRGRVVHYKRLHRA